LLQLDSTFSERNYGASSFLDFAEKLAQAGLVQLKHAGRSVMVELNDGFSEDAEAVKPRTEPGGTDAAAEAPQAVHLQESGVDSMGGDNEAVPLATEPAADGVR